MNTKDYREAPSGMGPLALEWKDKPHRLVYDLCTEVERLNNILTLTQMLLKVEANRVTFL